MQPSSGVNESMSKVVKNLDNSFDEKRLSELMRRAQDECTDSYKALLLELEKMISGFVKNSFFRLGLGDTCSCDDVTQEILVGIHAKRATYNPKQYFLPWFYSIARYKVIDHARAARTASKFINLIKLEITQATNEDTSSSHDLENLFNELSLKQRQVLELVKLQGFTISEAAAQTGFTNSDIKVTVHRAIKTLQKRLRRDTVFV